MPIENKGVNALARALGVHPMTVSRKMKKGMTEAQIRREAALSRAMGKAGPRARGNANAQRVSKPASGLGGYRPANASKVGLPITPTVTPIPNTKTKSKSKPGVKSRTPANPIIPSYTPTPDLDDSSYDPAMLASLEEARRREKWADAKRKELDLQQKQGDIAPIRFVNAFFARQIVSARDQLMQVGAQTCDRLAASEVAAECDKIVTDAIREILDKVTLFYESELKGVTNDV